MTAGEEGCPVCGLKSVPQGQDQCPQCDADLDCFRVLNSLPDAPAQQPPARPAFRAARLVAAGSAALAAALLFQRIGRLEHALGDASSKLDRLTAATAASQRRVEAALPGATLGPAAPAQSLGPLRDASAQNPLKPHPAPPESALYRVQPRDTLWSLARRYYGSGYLYPALLEANPGLDLYALEPGDPVRLPKELRMAGARRGVKGGDER